MNSEAKFKFLTQLAKIVGDNHVLTQPDQTEPFLIERRNLFNSACLAVIQPATLAQTSDCVKLCYRHDISIVPMGGNTGLCGGGVAEPTQIILSTARLNQVRHFDPKNYSMTVEAGCVLQNLQQTADNQDRLFPLSLGAEGSCQIGGNLATNAGGVNVLHYGNTRDLCLGIEAVLPDGSIYSDLSGLRKDNSGYALKHLLIGSEGTLGIITAATLKLFPKPVEVVTALTATDDLSAVNHLYQAVRRASSDRVTTFELMPKIALDLTRKHFPEQKFGLHNDHAWTILIVLHSTQPESDLENKLIQTFADLYEKNQISDGVIAQNLGQARHFSSLRESVVGAQKREGASIKHDISVPISLIPDFIEKAAIAVEAVVPGARPYPFGHVGDGNIHYNICQPANGDAKVFMSKRHEVNHAVLEIVHQLGGSFSAEHGVGILKADLISRYKGPVALQAMQNIKRALDPKNIMNPGKVVDINLAETDR